MLSSRPGAFFPAPGPLAVQGWSGLAVADAFFDPVAVALVHVAQVAEGTLEHRLSDAVAQLGDRVGDQPVAGGVVHHGADQGAGLAEVVVLGVRLERGPDDLPGGVPAGRGVPLR